MRAHTWIRWISILLAAGLAACSGSGSSGFDISPEAENLAIEQALDRMQCEELESLTICPSQDAAPSSPEGPIPEESLVDIQTGFDAEPFRCAFPEAGSCELDVFFTTGGFDEGTQFRVAARRVDPNSAWSISAAPMDLGPPEMPSFAVSVFLPADTQQVQLAVLVFVETEPIAAGTVDTLAETEADLAFVLRATPVQP